MTGKNNILTPCPFCGSALVKLSKSVDTIFAKKYRGKLRAVCCANCGCNGGIFKTLALTEEQATEKAISSWNRRAKDDDG